MIIQKIAVVTPYHNANEAHLRKAHESVLAQTVPARHVLVADGTPISSVDSWDADHIILPRPHGDCGDCARVVGVVHAAGLGFDAVALLDDDNWFEPWHLQNLVDLHDRTGANFLCSGRYLTRIDGSVMGVDETIDPQKFVDTNCMLFTRELFPLVMRWVNMPECGHAVGDRVIHQYFRQNGARIAHDPRPSSYYRCTKPGVYRRFGETPPEGCDPQPDYPEVFRNWVEAGEEPLI